MTATDIHRHIARERYAPSELGECQRPAASQACGAFSGSLDSPADRLGNPLRQIADDIQKAIELVSAAMVLEEFDIGCDEALEALKSHLVRMKEAATA